MSDISLEFYNSYWVAIAATIYFVIRNAMVRRLALLSASYFIYLSISGKLAGLLLLMSTVDYLLVGLMLRQPDRRGICLTLSVASNLSILFYFKYLAFFVDQIALLLGERSGQGTSFVAIAAPVGLSFIVFHGMSYAIDAYRGKIDRQPSYCDYLLYVAYFPKILAGPTTRATEFLPQLKSIDQNSLTQFVSGAEMVLLGAFKKVCVAAWFGRYWTELSATPGADVLQPFAAGACYGLFLLADFSGYTDIARGVSRMLGIELARNFDQPYGATSVSGFWRRWHMSLSFWLRDYLYFPLGGSKRGLPRTIANLMVTMSLCGLWHGAAWNFIIWGVLHGVVMSMERVARDTTTVRLPAIVGLILTWAFVSLTWILFASPNIEAAWTIMSGGLHASVGGRMALICLVTFALGPIFSYFGFYRWLVGRMESNNAVAFAINTAMIVAIVFQLWQGADINEFVYFRF